MFKNTELLDKYIIGYIPHQIYAFSTKQRPGYLKVGETGRPISIRLLEWKSKIPDLELVDNWIATVPRDVKDANSFFQDYALHQYFKDNGYHPLDASVAPGNSQEFYPVTTEIINEGITDISEDFESGLPYKYSYLSVKDNSIVKTQYKRDATYSLRPEQEQVVENIVSAIKDPTVPNNFLLYAVMRFGKTFVALEAAKRINSKLTLVVTAKADVKEEWKKGVESHVDFTDYVFLTGDDLKESNTVLSETLRTKHVVLFLTLQDLSGTDIKSKHQQLFNQQIDLLIVDESHFGARAQNYGQVISMDPQDRKRYFKKSRQDDSNDRDDKIEISALDNIKELNYKYKLHLSGTPYRILMGSEFKNPKQIVGKVQFKDILNAKNSWFKDHLDEPEYNNPYFGFPEMIRFAFNLSDEAKKKLKDLSAEGNKSELNELFGPVSNKKGNQSHNKFKHEHFVLDTLKSLDGISKSTGIFPILNYEKIKEGKMAHHIVMVLPYKASCDAMYKLLYDHKSELNNLQDYKILNIAGHDAPNGQTTASLVKQIAEYASNGQKTISLTVNKMLTGVTVPQWDAMIFMKDTQSPQEYDQAIYRLQSPYVTTLIDNDGQEKGKQDLKPQTILIDFAPNRMMSIEQYKAFVLSASEGEIGNTQIKQVMNEQMNVSPIITIDNETLTQVKEADIMKYVAAYSSEKGFAEEASEISVDLSILDNELIHRVIEQENELGSKSGLKFESNDSNDEETDASDIDAEDDSGIDQDGDDSTDDENINSDKDRLSENEKLVRKVQNYYLRILFYTFLSKETDIHSLDDVIASISRNERIARHLLLEKKVLVELRKSITNPWNRSQLDNKIDNANSLLADDTVSPSEKLSRAIKSFGRISESEVFTPKWVSDLMIDKVLEEIDPESAVPKIIDLTSKSGIYLLSAYDSLVNKGIKPELAKNTVYAVTTSPIAYEFTRKVYELMGFPTDHIMDIDHLSSYKLIEKDNLNNADSILNKYFFKGDKNMKFDVVVGNPPYQETNNKRNRDDAVYPFFYDLAQEIATKYILISPARFLFNVGSTPSNWNKKMLSDEHLKVIYFEQKSEKVFPNTEIKAGIVVLYRDNEKSIGPIETFTTYPELNSILEKVNPDDSFGDLMYVQTKFNLSALYKDFPEFEKRLGGNGKERRLVSSIFDTLSEIFFDEKQSLTQVRIYGRQNGDRVYKWIERKYIENSGNFDSYKVFVPAANGSGAIGEVLSAPIVGESEVGHTQTFISIGDFKTEFEAISLLNYLKTKFARAMLGIKKTTHNNKTKETWSKVPIQNFTNNSDIDWTKSISDIDQQLYKKYGLIEEEIEFIESKIKAME